MPMDVSIACSVPTHSSNRMGSESVGQLTDACDGFVAAFAHDVSCAQLLRQRDAVGVTAHKDDLLCPEPLGGNHGANADRTIPHDCDGRTGADAGGNSRVM